MVKVKAAQFDITSHCSFGNKQKYIKHVFEVMAFDPEVRTFCCELTPSFEMHHVYYDIEFAADVPEDVIDSCYEDLFSSETEAVSYYHCRVIDQKDTKQVGEFESLEDGREYLQGNYLCFHSKAA